MKKIKRAAIPALSLLLSACDTEPQADGNTPLKHVMTEWDEFIGLLEATKQGYLRSLAQLISYDKTV